MAISPFAFVPPGGWTDATRFPTYESSEAQVRLDMQELHDQTRDYINGLITQINANTLKVTKNSVNALPVTINGSSITSGHELLRAYLSNPAAQSGDWTVTTANGSVTISGSISGTTNILLILSTIGASIAG